MLASFAAPPRRTLLLGVLLVAACVAVYAPVRQFDFIEYDDSVYVTTNPIVAEGLQPARLINALYPYEANWIPLTWVSLALDVQIGGLAPGTFHLTNLILHALNALLLFVLFQRATGSVWRSWWVAALWALHPLRVESVAWVAERKDVLSMFWGLWAFIAYTSYATTRSRRAYALALGAFVCSVLSKPMLVTLPVLLCLFDLWPLRRVFWQGRRLVPAVNEGLWALLLEKIPFALVAFLVSIATSVAQRRGGAVVPLTAISLADRLSNAPVSAMLYLRDTLWPTRLAAFYPYTPQSAAAAVLCLVALLAVSVIVWHWRERRPYLLAGWIWYAAALVPVIGIVQVGEQSRADRYTYVPIVGVIVLVVWLAADLTARSRLLQKAATVIAALVVVALSVLTRQQVEYWRDSGTLFGRALEVTTDNYKAHQLLGLFFWNRQDDASATEHFKASSALRPNYPAPRLGLGNIALRRQDFVAAEQHFESVRSLNPTSVPALNGLGLVRANRDDLVGAVELFRQAAALRPDSASVHYNLGDTLARLGKPSEAVEQYRELVGLAPNDIGARLKLGLALSHMGDEAAAIEQFNAVIRLNPQLPEAHYSLGLSLAGLGRSSEALHALDQALALRPDWPLAQSLRAAVAEGRFPDSPPR